MNINVVNLSLYSLEMKKALQSRTWWLIATSVPFQQNHFGHNLSKAIYRCATCVGNCDNHPQVEKRKNYMETFRRHTDKLWAFHKHIDRWSRFEVRQMWSAECWPMSLPLFAVTNSLQIMKARLNCNGLKVWQTKGKLRWYLAPSGCDCYGGKFYLTNLIEGCLAVH